MKYAAIDAERVGKKSLPVRGAWVEMFLLNNVEIAYFSRSPCGERGLKCSVVNVRNTIYLVAPRAGSVG